MINYINCYILYVYILLLCRTPREEKHKNVHVSKGSIHEEGLNEGHSASQLNNSICTKKNRWKGLFREEGLVGVLLVVFFIFFFFIFFIAFYSSPDPHRLSCNDHTIESFPAFLVVVTVVVRTLERAVATAETIVVGFD